MLSAPVDVHDVDPHRALRGERTDHGAQGASRATAPADDTAEVVGVHADLEQVTTAQRLRGDADVFRVVHDAAHQVLEGLREHQASSPSAGAAGASAAAAAAFS